MRIVRQVFAALADPAGVIAHRPGALERVGFLMDDWRQTHRRLADTETRMTGILDDLQLTELVTSITGLSPVGAAAILAETGDPRRFATARALVKHAGLAPREKLSGTFTGRTKLTGQGRPGLRLAAWRAVWGAQRANPVYAARFAHLTSRQQNRLTATQAQSRHRGGDLAPAARRHHHRPALGSGDRHPRNQTPDRDAHRRLTPRRPVEQGRGEPHAAWRNFGYLDGHHGQPRPSSHQPDYTLPGPTPLRLCRDRRRTRHRPQSA